MKHIIAKLPFRKPISFSLIFGLLFISIFTTSCEKDEIQDTTIENNILTEQTSKSALYDFYFTNTVRSAYYVSEELGSKVELISRIVSSREDRDEISRLSYDLSSCVYDLSIDPDSWARYFAYEDVILLLDYVVKDGVSDKALNFMNMLYFEQSFQKDDNLYDDDQLRDKKVLLALLANDFDKSLEIASANFSNPVFPHYWSLLYYVLFEKDKAENGGKATKGESELRWESYKEAVHLALDAGGLIPVVGEAFDLINAGIYLYEGDFTNAGLSAASAIPFAGWAASGTKLVVTVTTLYGGSKALKVISKNTTEIAALANKLKDKFNLVVENGIQILKDKTGKTIARGNDVAQFTENLSKGILGIVKEVAGKIEYKNLSGNVLKWSPQHPSSIRHSIRNALRSADPGKFVEGKVADALQKAGKDIKSFGMKVKNITTNNLAGDIDVETANHLIEVKKTYKSLKEGQLNKFVNSNNDNYLNPFQKETIVYIDEPLSAADRANVLSQIPSDVTLINSLDQLLNIID